MDKSQEPPKKCFCARCFLPIGADDKVDIEGQNFHRMCSMCCICQTIPTSLKMFYGHVFCNDCFKTNVVSRFKGDSPRMHSNSWWMQWAPGVKPQEGPQEGSKEKSEAPPQDSLKPEEPCKRCICARCLEAVSNNNKVDIGGQSFHTQCAKCYCCHAVPKDNVKIYYGQVFCEECFHRHVMNRNRDNPTEFFKNCFEQWQSNAQFAENMREMMSSNNNASPFVFMMHGHPYCRCGGNMKEPEWTQPSETRKSATPALSAGEQSLGTWDQSLCSRTDASDAPESNESAVCVGAAEKIEKLTKYLHERTTNMPESEKKWKNYELDSLHGWADLQDPRVCVNCPKCLWQRGAIYVNSEYLQKEVRCGDY